MGIVREKGMASFMHTLHHPSSLSKADKLTFPTVKLPFFWHLQKLPEHFGDDCNVQNHGVWLMSVAVV